MINSVHDIQERSFAEGCYDTDSIRELAAARSSEPDAIDLKTWDITADEWTEAVESVLLIKLAEQRDADEVRVDKGGRVYFNGPIPNGDESGWYLAATSVDEYLREHSA
jgi:hypothetical protein